MKSMLKDFIDKEDDPAVSANMSPLSSWTGSPPGASAAVVAVAVRSAPRLRQDS